MAKFFLRMNTGVGGTGGFKFGWNAPESAYDGILDETGVVKLAGENAINESDRSNIIFGANSPRPPKIRISYLDRDLGGGTSNDNIKSVTRFCAPDKLDGVLGGNLNTKQVNVNGTNYDIQSVTMAS